MDEEDRRRFAAVGGYQQVTTERDHSESRSEPVTADEARAFLTFAVKPDTLAGDLQAAVRLLQAEATQSANTRLAEQEREIGALTSNLRSGLEALSWGPLRNGKCGYCHWTRGTDPIEGHSTACPMRGLYEIAEALANPSSAPQAHDEQVRREAVTLREIVDAADGVLSRNPSLRYERLYDAIEDARALLANDGEPR